MITRDVEKKYKDPRGCRKGAEILEHNDLENAIIYPNATTDEEKDSETK
jgi:hypothetical protein